MSPDCHADIPSHSVLMHGIKDALRLWGAVAWPPMSEVYIVHLREHGMQATGIPGVAKQLSGLLMGRSLPVRNTSVAAIVGQAAYRKTHNSDDVLM